MDAKLLHIKATTSSLTLLPSKKSMYQNKKFLPLKLVMSAKHSKCRSIIHVKENTTKPVDYYRDNWVDMMAINHLTHNLQVASGLRIEKEGYEGLLETCKAVSTKFNSVQQRQIVLESLERAIPLLIRLPLGLFLTLLPHNQSFRELYAIFTGLFFAWLVGPSEVKESEFNGRREKNVAHIKKCRFLESSKCVGMCINLCKFPTQTFLKDLTGVPVTMVPNFEDMSCDVIFGVEPPSPDKDPVIGQPCNKLCEIRKRHTTESCPSQRHKAF